jgi:lysophospholipase L1-like esterase
LKYNKFVLFILYFSLLCFLLLSFGFIKGAYTVLNPKKSTIAIKQKEKKVTEQKNDKLTIVTLGDSLTRGVGDEEGLGYVSRVKASLKKTFKTNSTISNLAVSGAKTGDLLIELQKKSVQQSISNADAIFLTIGSNDLFPGADRMNQNFLSTYRPDEKTFSKNLQTIFKQIRQSNQHAKIYAIGYYNPFHNVQGLDASSSFVSRWNQLLEQAVLQVQNAYVIPTFDLFYNEESKYLYTDHFHPNKNGYLEIAQRLSEKLGSQLGGE